MARISRLLIAAATACWLAVLAPALVAEEPAASPVPTASADATKPSPRGDRTAEPDRPRPDRPLEPGPKFRDMLRERAKQVPPERREHILRNMERWETLPPEQKEQLRRTFEERRRRMIQEAEGAMRDLGLDLQGPRREAFLRRYAEERKAIEDDLRRHVEQERAARLPKLLEKLRAEFGGSPGDSPTVSENP